jgi:hypothetical protein
MSQIEEHGRQNAKARGWFWWAKWLFGSWAFVVLGLIVSMLLFAPFIGLDEAGEFVVHYSGALMILFFAIGGLVCFRFLK